MSHSTDPQRAVERALLDALSASRGHFLHESGHHGDVWLDLNGLFVDARRVRAWAADLARRGASCVPEFVCGPLTGGAFVAQALAEELGAGFLFAERLALGTGPVRYRLPTSLRALLPGRRVLLVDDAVSAGSAWLATLADLLDAGAEPTGFACLVSLGDAAARIAAGHHAPLFALASLERGLWTPGECPLCRSGVPLVDPLNPG